MDGSVMNLLQAERETAKIIAAAQEERKSKQDHARTTAQTRINVVQQGLQRKFEVEQNEVSVVSLMECNNDQLFVLWLVGGQDQNREGAAKQSAGRT